MSLLRRLVLASVLCVTAALSAAYLPPGVPAATVLLAPPPPVASAEARAELDQAAAVHHAATAEELAQATAENTLTIFHFAPAIGPWFVPGKFPKTEALFKAVEADSRQVTNAAKNFFKRPRPYHTAPERFTTAVEHEDPTHYSYPSGHSTRGTMFALLLAELVPDRREAILAKGRETGWLRVQGGVHYPSDILAGRVLGQALVREFLANPAFQADLAAARAELAAAAK